MNDSVTPLLDCLRRLASPLTLVSDAVLLQQYAAHRDNEAFTELVRRHGPMVLAVCRHVLGAEDSAEDAFQATFLALARQVCDLRRPEVVAAWLHGTARRIALKARLAQSRRQRQERRWVRPVPTDSLDDLSVRELLTIVDEELARLPETYRLPIVLCYLEGRTQEEAARQLGWTPGSVKGRLERGRSRLQARLVRRGITLTGTLAAVLIPRQVPAVPQALFDAAARIGTSPVVTPAVAVLADAPSAVVRKLPLAAALFASGLLMITAGFLAPPDRASAPPETTDPQQVTAPPAVQALARTDLYGDPLPAGAVARVGTVRWWFGRDVECPLVFASDGKTLVFCDSGRAVRLLDVATGKELHRLQPPGDSITAFALSPDNKVLVTASWQRPVLHVWDASTGKELRQLAGCKEGTGPVAFSPDGKTFIAASASVVTSDKLLRFWDVGTWQETRRLEIGWPHAFVLLPDGNTLVSNFFDSIRWWNLRTGQEIRHLAVRRNRLPPVVLSPNGKTLAAIMESDPVALYIWDASNARQIHRAVLPSGNCLGLAFSPDSRTIACTSRVGRRGSIMLFFSAETGREIRRWNEDEDVTHLAFSPDGRVLAQVAGDVIRLRGREMGKSVLQMPGLPNRAMSVRFAGDGKKLVLGCFGGQSGLYDPLTGAQLAASQKPPDGFARPADMLLAPAMTPDGKKTALVDAKGALHVWDTASGKELCLIDKPPVGEDQADFSPDGKLVVVKHKDYIIRLWNTAAGKLLHSLPMRQGPGRNFPHPHTFSADGRMLATAPFSNEDRTIRLWETATARELGRLAWDDDTYPSCLAFSSDGTRLVAAHGDSGPKPQGPLTEQFSLRLWDLATRRELLRIPTQASDIRALAVSPDGKTLAVGYSDIRLWEVASGRSRGSFTGHQEWIWSLAFSPDGQLLASGSLDRTALVWDLTGVCPDGHWTPRQLAAVEMERLWSDLTASDAVRAYHALWKMALAGSQSVHFLGEHLQPAVPVEHRLGPLLADLDNSGFAVRQKASRELADLDTLAEPALRQALKNGPSPEARQRIERLLAGVEGPVTSPQLLRALRSVEVLEHIGTTEAQQVLAKLAQGAAGARITQEAKASLQRLAGRN